MSLLRSFPARGRVELCRLADQEIVEVIVKAVAGVDGVSDRKRLPGFGAVYIPDIRLREFFEVALRGVGGCSGFQ